MFIIAKFIRKKIYTYILHKIYTEQNLNIMFFIRSKIFLDKTFIRKVFINNNFIPT
jgi:hypothetical protein